MIVEKFGFELEIAHWRPLEFATLIYESDLTNIKLKRDGSVHVDYPRKGEVDMGTEICFKTPIKKIDTFIKQTKAISKFCHDNNLKFTATGPYRLPMKYIIRRKHEDSECGVHIHYGIPRAISDQAKQKAVVKLIDLCLEHEAAIIKLAGRRSTYATPFCEFSRDHLAEIKKNPRRLMKYVGCNLRNLYAGDSKHTVEFRYAHAAIIMDHDRFEEYFRLCLSIVEEAFNP